jgi:hypothetical protein
MSKQTLECVSKEVYIIAAICLLRTLLSGPRTSESVTRVFLCVLAFEVPPHDSSDNEAADIVREIDGMTLEVSWSSSLGIGISTLRQSSIS